MKKILIIETAKISTSTSIAHVRNAITLYNHLSTTFDCVLRDLTHDYNLSEQWDIILFSYATGRADFSKVEPMVHNQKNAKIGWITNEFELFANGFVKEHMTFMINNFDEAAIKKAHRHDQLLTTNLNTLIMREPNNKVDKKYDMIYYGTYRKYRQNYFKKYFTGDMILSTSKKNWKSFVDVGGECNVTDKLSWSETQETLNLCKSSLYIEDTKTHEWFNYMANRFFEGLYCNTPMFFDTSCLNTVEKDVYDIDNYFMVGSYQELESKVNNLDMDMVDRYLSYNVPIALNEKKNTLNEITTFLGEL